MDNARDILNYMQEGLQIQGGKLCEFEIIDRDRARALVWGKDGFAWVTVEMTNSPQYLEDHPSPWPRGEFFEGQIG